MRLLIIAVALLLMPIATAAAQSQITLDGAQNPIVDAQINGRPVRLEVDLRLPDILVLNPEAAERLRVRRAPFVAARVSLDEAYIRGRVARPRIEFGDAGASRAITGIFNVPATDRADGVIGPGVLPHDIIRIELGGASGRTVRFPLANADVWDFEVQLAELSVDAVLDLTTQRSTFNRTASSQLDERGAIVANGEHTETSLLLGLRAMTQPVESNLQVQGLSLNPAQARTRAPLMGALDDDTIFVVAEGEAPRPRLWIGRGAFANCASVTVDRRSRTLTLECAP